MTNRENPLPIASRTSEAEHEHTPQSMEVARPRNAEIHKIRKSQKQTNSGNHTNTRSGESQILAKRRLAKSGSHKNTPSGKNEIRETEVWQKLGVAKTRNPEKSKSRKTMFDNIWESQQQEIRENEILEKRSLAKNEILETEVWQNLEIAKNKKSRKSKITGNDV